jgi:hypothetical protein
MKLAVPNLGESDKIDVVAQQYYGRAPVSLFKINYLRKSRY